MFDGSGHPWLSLAGVSGSVKLLADVHERFTSSMLPCGLRSVIFHNYVTILRLRVHRLSVSTLMWEVILHAVLELVFAPEIFQEISGRMTVLHHWCCGI